MSNLEALPSPYAKIANIYEGLQITLANPKYERHPSAKELLFSSGLKQYVRQERKIQIPTRKGEEVEFTVSQIGDAISIDTEGLHIGLTDFSRGFPPLFALLNREEIIVASSVLRALQLEDSSEIGNQ